MESNPHKFTGGIAPVPSGFFRRNRERLLTMLKGTAKFESNGLIFLSGPHYLRRYDDDATERIIFEPFFYYLFGITEDVDTYGVIEIATGKAIVFARPPEPGEELGRRFRTLDEFKAAYEIDDAWHTIDLAKYFDSKGAKDSYTIYLNGGISPVSSLPTLTPQETFKAVLEGRKVNLNDLYMYGREVRVFKSLEEVQILRDAIKIANFAHRAVWRMSVAGTSEKQLSDYFSSVNRIYNSDVPYPNIFCAGKNGAYLHYEPSPNVLFENGQLCLNDSGGKVHGYNSDITRTFPINGKFSQKQREIYDLVLLSQTKSLELTKPGILWGKSKDLSKIVIADGLHKLKLLQGNLDNDALKLKLGGYFMPHGLGHYIGLYVHDLPGIEAQPDPDPRPKPRPDRILEKGMVITVEPGIYFIDSLLERGYNDKEYGQYFNRAVIEEYKKEVGGVRIEDMYLITADGYEDLSRDLIKTADAIEEFMRR